MSKFLKLIGSSTPAVITTASPAVVELKHSGQSSYITSASPAVITTAPPAVKGAKRPHRCALIQDGHSTTEQAIFSILADAGQITIDGDRLTSLSVPEIAKRTKHYLRGGIHERNIPVILQRLVAKRAIAVEREEQSRQRTARCYRVYHYKRIIKLRQEAGLEWVIRGRGVEFVDPSTGAVIRPPAVITTAPPAVERTTSPAISPPAVMVAPSLLELNPKICYVESSSSVALVTDEQTTTALTRLLGVDISSAKRIWLHCTSSIHDITPEEIEEQFTPKLRALFRTKMKSPIGFLLKDMDTWFNPDSIRQGREAKAAEKAENDACWREVLADPDSTEEMKSLAKNYLGETQPPD